MIYSSTERRTVMDAETEAPSSSMTKVQRRKDIQLSSPLALLSSEELMRLQRRRIVLRKKKMTVCSRSSIYTTVHSCKHEEEEEVEEVEVDDERIMMMPISSPSPSKDKQLQHPRRRYRRQLSSRTTKEEKGANEDHHKPLFHERGVARSVSLGLERPCMKKTTARCVMLDSPLPRPYRQLSAEYLQSLSEETIHSTTTTNTTSSNNDTQASDSNNSAFDSDCEGDCEGDDPTNEVSYPVIPAPVAFTTDTVVQMPLLSPSDVYSSFSEKKFDYSKRSPAFLSYKSLDLSSTNEQKRQRQRQLQLQLQQRPCMAESTSRGAGCPTRLMLSVPIMPIRKLSICNLSIDDILSNDDDVEDEDEEERDNE